MPGCRPVPQWGAGERQPHTDVFLPLFHPPFSSKNKYIKSLKKTPTKQQKKQQISPGWVAQLAGASFCTPKVVGSIPGQGAHRNQLIDIFLSKNQ